MKFISTSKHPLRLSVVGLSCPSQSYPKSYLKLAYSFFSLSQFGFFGPDEIAGRHLTPYTTLWDKRDKSIWFFGFSEFFESIGFIEFGWFI